MLLLMTCDNRKHLKDDMIWTADRCLFVMFAANDDHGNHDGDGDATCANDDDGNDDGALVFLHILCFAGMMVPLAFIPNFLAVPTHWWTLDTRGVLVGLKGGWSGGGGCPIQQIFRRYMRIEPETCRNVLNQY